MSKIRSKGNQPWKGIKNLVVRAGWCHARVEFAGKQIWRALHIEADPAGMNVHFAQDAIRAFKLELAQGNFAILQLTKSRSETSRVADIFRAYRGACEGREISPQSVDRAVGWVGTILRVVHGEDFVVEEARATVFNRELLERYLEAKIGGVKREAEVGKWPAEAIEQRMRSTKNSAKSAIQQARSIFARDLLQSRHYRALQLPDLKDYLAFRVDGASVSPFVRPRKEVWQAVVDGLAELKRTDSAMWFAFQLAANAGLRRGSAAAARWDWFRDLENGEAEMQIRRAKGNSYFVRIDAGVWKAWKDAKASDDYVIPADSDEERVKACRRVVAWLRDKGIDDNKPFHYLRKVYGNEIAAAHGLSEAQNALGHSKADLTHQVYQEHRSIKSVRGV